jgi:Zn-dependent peptidase ImmA (M78 family)
MDDRAFEFACCLLISDDDLRTVFSELSAVVLAQAKEAYGISMAAMIFRAERQKIIGERTAKKLWIQFAKRGWRANEPGRVRPDRAVRLESILDRAVFDRQITMSEAAATMGVSRRDLDERMKMAMGCQDTNQDEPEGGSFSLRLHG